MNLTLLAWHAVFQTVRIETVVYVTQEIPAGKQTNAFVLAVAVENAWNLSFVRDTCSPPSVKHLSVESRIDLTGL